MLELTDENFEKEIQGSAKPVVVDFFAGWCGPCFVLAPIFEKLAEEYREKIIFAKSDLDLAPLASQKLGIERIPAMIFFEKGKPVSGFVGLRPEPVIKEWLDKILAGEDGGEMERLIKEYEAYAAKKGFKLNPDRAMVERLVKGLLANEQKHGQKYCPCRRVSGNQAEDQGKVCPCQWHEQEIEENGRCFCGLFVK